LYEPTGLHHPTYVLERDAVVAPAELAQFIDVQGRVTAWPAKPKKQREVLEYLAARFEPGVEYSEKQVNALLDRWHTFADPALLRRELYMKKFLDRAPDGSRYWKTG